MAASATASHRRTLRLSGINCLSSACPAYIRDLGLFITMSAQFPSNGASPSAGKMTTTKLEATKLEVQIHMHMMTSSNGNTFLITGPLCGEFTDHRWLPLTKATDAELWCFFFNLGRNKRLNKYSWGWWFKPPSSSLGRHCNDVYWFDVANQNGQSVAWHFKGWYFSVTNNRSLYHLTVCKLQSQKHHCVMPW